MTRLNSLLGAALALALLSQCRAGQHYAFQGFVYDGVTRKPITTYRIELAFGGTKIPGKVDATGKYTLEGLMDKFDYTVTIAVDGYRPFESYNLARTDSDTYNQTIYHYYNAFVFPKDAQTPAYSLPVRLQDSDTLPNGRAQFTPQAVSGDLDVNQSGFGGSGTFSNSLDLSTGVVVKDFSNGNLGVDAGELKFGVSYNIVIFGVGGYAYNKTQSSFIAGYTPASVLLLTRLDSQNTNPLRYVFKNDDNGAISSNGDLVIVLNQPVELPDDETQTAINSTIDDGIVLKSALKPGSTAVSASPNYDQIKNQNAARNARGGKVTIDSTGTKITISSSGTGAFAKQDSATVWCSVIYNGLNSVRIRPKSGSTALRQPVSLGSLSNPDGNAAIGDDETVTVAATDSACSIVAGPQL